MTVCIRDRGDARNQLQLCVGHFERLLVRGVFMPAGVFCVDPKRIYMSDRFPDSATMSEFGAGPAEARGCAMAMRAYADAVKYADEKGREWVDRYDRELRQMEEGIVWVLMTCRGFDVR